MKKIILLRHAAAQLHQYGANDHERSISLVGMYELDAIKNTIKKKEKKLSDINLILCSNARRCRQTLDGLSSILPSGAEMVFEDDLYRASIEFLEGRFRQIKNKWDTVLIVGHNPGFLDMLNQSSLGRTSKETFQFPTCSFCFMSAPVSRWDEFSASLVQFDDFITTQNP